MTCRPASAVLAVVLILLAPSMLACDANGRRDRARQARAAREAESAATYQAEVEESLGAAVAILVDTSGSMRDEAPGDARPKYAVAQEALEAMLDALPRPGGGTAIGEALRAARPDLYRAGVFRKYVIVVTDGENTSGRSPDEVAREIHEKSEGAVQVYFVAFDTSPEKFSFLKDAGGDVIGAGTGVELRAALDRIYQGKILAEAPDAGEREPAKR